MSCHGRPSRRRVCPALAWAVLWMASSVPWVAAEPAAYPRPFLDDAELHDVTFVDPDRGWAVGDRGVIWQTEDGGRHWHLNPAPIACRLESVCFVDDQHGWIVGSWTRPHTHESVGVVLHTTDGGRHWEPIRRAALPALRHVHFLDARHGWAVGQADALYPAGIFHTEDGGLSWSSVPGTNWEGWQTADWLSGDLGSVGGRHGAVACLRSQRFQSADTPALGLRAVRSVRLSGPSPGDRSLAIQGHSPAWLVGDGGLVLRSTDHGITWAVPATPLPPGSEAIDFHDVALADGQAWIVGNPGSRVLHSPDGGNSWSALATGNSLPLRGVYFLDAQRGWAVGSLGTILATRDGGRTWSLQRRGGRRAALLGIFAHADRIPLEALARVCGDEGYLTALEIIGSGDENLAVEAKMPREDRVREAVLTLGASAAETAWQFPIRHPATRVPGRVILQDWDALHHQQAAEVLERYLVTRIRTWRPEVIVTESPGSRNDAPLGQLICQAVLAAVEQAAEETAYPELKACGLEPWTVKKVFSSLGGDVAGTINITTSQLASRLGGTLADEARSGWQLLHERSHPAPQTYGFRLLVSHLPEEVGGRDLFSGTSSSHGSENRRELHAPPPSDLRTLSRMALQRRNVEQLLSRLSENGTQGDAWLSQVGNLVQGLDARSGGEILMEMAFQLHDRGRPDLAADVLDLLVKRYPEHDLLDASLVWLLQYHASAEAAWAFRTASTTVTTGGMLAAPAQAAPAADGVAPASFQAADPTRSASNVALYQQPVIPPRNREAWTAQYGEMIRHTRPSLYWEPRVRFPLACTDRATSRHQDADSYFQQLVSTRPMDCWWACGRSELWIQDPRRRSPKPVIRSTRVAERPRLDGRLDDPAWADCLPLTLTSPHGDDADWPAAVMLAYDKQFLYLAASCGKSPASTSEIDQASARPRDADLADHDRLDILIDVDRDYVTYFHLTVDHRGWARDACLGSLAWNPQWYIAASETPRAWQVEAAIPWTELQATAPAPGDHWALGIQRVVPGAGFQSWTVPASPDILPAGFGLLGFD
jgi:photosystem II stability/assembly factor-like uncharacterized protein